MDLVVRRCAEPHARLRVSDRCPALNRVRIRVPDKPGCPRRITQTARRRGINIEDFELRHVSPDYGGVLVVLVTGAENAELARTLLKREG